MPMERNQAEPVGKSSRTENNRAVSTKELEESMQGLELLRKVPVPNRPQPTVEERRPGSRMAEGPDKRR